MNFFYSGTSDEISFVILSQENEYDLGVAEDLKEEICQQAFSSGEVGAFIYSRTLLIVVSFSGMPAYIFIS